MPPKRHLTLVIYLDLTAAVQTGGRRERGALTMHDDAQSGFSKETKTPEKGRVNGIIASIKTRVER